MRVGDHGGRSLSLGLVGEMGVRRMKKRAKRKTTESRRADEEKRQFLSAYAKVGNAYDISTMLPTIARRLVGRLLVTKRVWDVVIRSAPSAIEAKWRLEDLAYRAKMSCTGIEPDDCTLRTFAVQKASHWQYRPRIMNNRTIQFDLAVLDHGLYVKTLKLVNLVDRQGNREMLFMTERQDESAVLASKSLSPADDVDAILEELEEQL